VKISVVVPTYNEARGIREFLDQFRTQSLPRTDFEIIVVDGGSTDGTVGFAEQMADRVVTQTSKGIGGARNDGVAVARADLIATTDADCRVPADWLENIVDDFDDPRVVAVCGPDGPFDGGLKARTIFFFVRAIIRIAAAAGIYGTGGTNSGFRKDAFRAIGGYRGLPHSDDIDLGARIRARGRIRYDPRLFVRLSVRRLEKQGYMRTLLLWLRGDLKVLAGREFDAPDYARQEY
jgi:glycosyltransferase involved in cell wall biosynthesis